MGENKKTMKKFICGFCGHIWTGESGDHCPICKHKREAPQRYNR